MTYNVFGGTLNIAQLNSTLPCSDCSLPFLTTAKARGITSSANKRKHSINSVCNWAYTQRLRTPHEIS